MPSRADVYAGSYHHETLHRAMFLCKVVLGRPFNTNRDIPSLREPPEGYDSVSIFVPINVLRG